jgi:hypothetical protein
MQMQLHRRQVKIGSQPFVSPHAQVTAWVAGNRQAAAAKAERVGGNYFEHITPANWEKTGLQVMEAIRPLFGDAQA